MNELRTRTNYIAIAVPPGDTDSYKISLQVSPGLLFRNFLILVLTIFWRKNLDLVFRFILRKLWK